MVYPANQLELIESFGIPRLSGPNGQKFIGCVFAAINDMLVEACATLVRARMLYDVNPRTPDEGLEQPYAAIQLLGQEAMLPLYPGESHDSLLTQLQRKWDHYSGGVKAALESELQRAGYNATVVVPNDQDLTPTFVTTRVTSGTGAVSAPWPTGHIAGQLGLLIIETANEVVPIVANWTLLADVGVGVAGGASATRCTVYARIAESASEADAEIGDAGDHVVAVIATFDGCDFDLDALVVTSTTSADADVTAVSLAAADADTKKTLQCFIVATQIAPAGLTTQANAALTDITEVFDSGSGSGNDGGIAITTGKLAAIGSAGTWTGTLSVASRWAAVVVSLSPLQYWSRFWIDVEDSPLTGPGLSFGAHRVGLDVLGPAGGTLQYFSTLRSIVSNNKPIRWIPWEFRFPLSDGSGTIRLAGSPRVRPFPIYFS